MAGKRYPGNPHLEEVDAMKPRQLCGVNKVCRRARAAWWYWTETVAGMSVCRFARYTPGDPPPAAGFVAVVCQDCKVSIQASYDRFNGVEST